MRASSTTVYGLSVTPVSTTASVEDAPGPDHRACPDTGVAAEPHARLDDHVAADLRRPRRSRTGGVLDGHALACERLGEPADQRAPRPRQLGAVVHPGRLRDRHLDRRHAAAVGCHGHQVRQVELALRVRRSRPGRAPSTGTRPRRSRGRRSPPGWRARRRRRPSPRPRAPPAALVSHDAPVSARRVEHHGGEREWRSGAARRRDHRPERLGREQRRVAGEDQHRAAVAAQGTAGLQHGVRGPELLGLEREPERGAGEGGPERGLDGLGLVPDHDHDPVGAQLQGARNREVRQRDGRSTSWRTLARADFIRVPFPAARTTAASGVRARGMRRQAKARPAPGIKPGCMTMWRSERTVRVPVGRGPPTPTRARTRLRVPVSRVPRLVAREGVTRDPSPTRARGMVSGRTGHGTR